MSCQTRGGCLVSLICVYAEACFLPDVIWIFIFLPSVYIALFCFVFC